MGMHFVHSELISDTVLDPLLPEALMYEPEPNGQLRLVGVEYIVFQEAWDAKHWNLQCCWGSSFTLCPAPTGTTCQRSTNCTSGCGSTTPAASSTIGIHGCAALMSLRTDRRAHHRVIRSAPMYGLC